MSQKQPDLSGSGAKEVTTFFVVQMEEPQLFQTTAVTSSYAACFERFYESSSLHLKSTSLYWVADNSMRLHATFIIGA